MTSLHFVFNTNIKHPEELAARRNQRYPRFLPKEFDVNANEQERHDIRALIDELIQNNNHDAIIDCMSIALTEDSRHTMLMDIYGLHISVSEIQEIIKKHYQIVTEGKMPTIKLNDEKSEFQIEITA